MIVVSERETITSTVEPSPDGWRPKTGWGSWRRSQPDKPALIDDPPSGPVRSITYRQLDEEANRIANALHRAGVEPGHRTAWMGRNSIEAVEFIKGAGRAGTPAVALNHRMAREEAARILQFAGARLVWVEADMASVLIGIEQETDVRHVVVFGGPPETGQTAAEDFLTGAPTTPRRPRHQARLPTG